MNSYPGHELSIPQLLHALRTKIECGELVEVTNSDPSRISELERDAHRVHASIRFALNGFSPINQRLPPETLALVPSFLVRDCDRIVATHVCRHWRDTFLSTPTLWDVVPASDNLDKTIAYLERSGGLPLKISISSWGPRSENGWESSFRVLGQHSHRFRALTLSKYHRRKVDVFSVLENPLPNLTELDIHIPESEAKRSEAPYRFPSLKSLILRADITYLLWFQLTDLRKLGVSCAGWGWYPPRLLEHLEKAPLLEELEFSVDQSVYSAELDEDVPPVKLKHLQRMVFRGTLPQFLPSLISRIIHPHDTKFVVTCYIPGDRKYPLSHNLPQASHLPILMTPKHIRYQFVHDQESSETRTCIDLISTDGRHISIENRYGWPEDFSLNEADGWDLDAPCLEFMKTIDLSSVERLCFEGCSPDSKVIQELLDTMGKLETLVVVDGDPHVIFMAMQSLRPPEEICPLLRRLVILCDLDIYIQWGEIVRIVRDRAAGGSPLEQVTFTSSFDELLEEPEHSVELLEEVTEVIYDLGRDTIGWEWWKE